MSRKKKTQQQYKNQDHNSETEKFIERINKEVKSRLPTSKDGDTSGERTSQDNIHFPPNSNDNFDSPMESFQIIRNIPDFELDPKISNPNCDNEENLDCVESSNLDLLFAKGANEPCENFQPLDFGKHSKQPCSSLQEGSQTLCNNESPDSLNIVEMESKFPSSITLPRVSFMSLSNQNLCSEEDLNENSSSVVRKHNQLMNIKDKDFEDQELRLLKVEQAVQNLGQAIFEMQKFLKQNFPHSAQEIYEKRKDISRSGVDRSVLDIDTENFRESSFVLKSSNTPLIGIQIQAFPSTKHTKFYDPHQ